MVDREGMTHYPDDFPGEADFRAEFGPYMEAVQEMWLDEAIRPKLMDAVEGRITWDEFRACLRTLEERRGSGWLRPRHRHCQESPADIAAAGGVRGGVTDRLHGGTEDASHSCHDFFRNTGSLSC